MRKEYDYDYTIHPDNSPKKFEEVCRRLKDKGFGDGRHVVDVDGSTYQEYQTKNGEVIVLDDYDIGAVYVLADFNLSETLGSLIWKTHGKGA